MERASTRALSPGEGGIFLQQAAHLAAVQFGEQVGHIYAGPMASETAHFVEAVVLDRPVLVTPEQARRVMELYIAADLSAELNEPVTLPLENKRPAGRAAGV